MKEPGRHTDGMTQLNTVKAFMCAVGVFGTRGGVST